ncbi:DUF3515 family protein [Salininema proteolyticum]|uniref:DUF3515 family protein n=1 Tax=Salininema proteolyticum TaxID=1607685 RepID=A0ABV8TYL2_9ACTN
MPKLSSPGAIATIVAVPIALVVGYASYAFLGDLEDEPEQPDESAVAEPVEMDPLELGADALTYCLAVTSSAPGEVDGLEQRPVVGGEGIAEYALAYGDPAVTAVCGTDPVEVPPTDQVVDVSGVCWLKTPGDDGSIQYATVDRETAVTVDVPSDYEQSGGVLGDLSPVIADKIPALRDAPAGCAAK